MKTQKSIAKHGLAAWLTLSVGAVICSAAISTPNPVTPPALQLADASGNSVTVDSTGTVQYTGTCNATTCPNSPSVGSGFAGFNSVTIGSFVMVNVYGETKPFLPVATPSLDLGLGSVSSATGGVLTASWTDTQFSATGPLTYTIQNTGGTATYSTYIDPTNKAFGEQSGTLVGALTGILSNITQALPFSQTVQPVSITQVAVITIPANGSFSNDFGVTAVAATSGSGSSGGTTGGGSTPTPSISMTKTANVTKVNPFQKVTYTYKITNGPVALTNVVIMDDSATPDFAGDDVQVCKIANLAASATYTCTASLYPPVTEGANDTNQSSGYGNWDGYNDGGWNSWGGWGYGGGSSSSFDYTHAHAGGRLICKSESNGDITFTYLVDQGISDNTFGKGSSSGWGWFGANFTNLQNAGAEFQIIDGYGNNVLDFTADYVSKNSSFPSGYGTCGVKGGGGAVYKGNSNCIVKIDTSITDNLNRSKAFNKCTGDSPSTSPDWDNKCSYTVRVSSSAWGSHGFGGVACPVVTHTSKGSSCGQHTVKPISSTATNTATVTGYAGTVEVISTAKATVTIDASQKGWSKCSQF